MADRKQPIQSLLHPGLRQGEDSDLAEKRSAVASVFIAMLIGMAYAEMFGPVRESVRAHGLEAGTVFLGLTFFFTAMRFFIGNQLHLLSKSVVRMRGDIWLYDFLIITFQTLILCFLGGLSAVQRNRGVPIDFVDLLVLLYGVDVGWIVSQWLAGLLNRRWRRDFVPWAWAIMNASLGAIIVGVDRFAADVYATPVLAALLALSFVAFLLDLVLIDFYDLI